MSEQDNQVLEATNSNDNQEVELNLEEVQEGTEAQDYELLNAELEKAKEIKKAYEIRAKKAEAELKTLKSEAPQINNNQTLTVEAVETKILKAQGMSDDDIARLKKIASINGTGIIEAQSDDLFTGWKEKKESEEKANKAKLGASRGSGSVKKSKDFTTPGLSDEERKELWRQSRDN